MHIKWVEAQNDLYSGEAARLSDTRWACRVADGRNIRDLLDASIFFRCCGARLSGDRVAEAKDLWTMIDFKLVLLLHFLCDLLGQTQLFSMQLQEGFNRYG